MAAEQATAEKKASAKARRPAAPASAPAPKKPMEDVKLAILVLRTNYMALFSVPRRAFTEEQLDDLGSTESKSSPPRFLHRGSAPQPVSRAQRHRVHSGLRQSY
jgi:hypothetical protein